MEGWEQVASITGTLATDESLMAAVVEAIRDEVPEIAALELDDVVAHTGLFVGAGLRAVAELRGPTRDELDFVARLASTRAAQGVPITAMLAGIYEGQRLVWERAADRFEAAGVPLGTITAAFVRHLEWAKEVQATAIGAHRTAELEAARRERDARAELLHMLLTATPLPHHRAELRTLGMRDLATASALYVHPNTIRYRLERLQELAGVALPTDMDGRVRLWWAARAWRDAGA